MSFESFNPTRVVFGSGSLQLAGARTGELGTAALVVCGRRAMRRHGVLDRLLASLRAAGLAVEVFDGVSPDPKVAEVDEAIALARRSRSDVVVGLGGGSALDAAKATGVGAGRESIADLVGSTLDALPGSLPVVAVPTTTGSGAEVTKGAILSDPQRGVKAGIRGEAVFPRLALVDPELAATQPSEVFAETGFDALTHALEGYVARRATPVSEPLAERALSILGASLPRLARGERSTGLCEELALAALLGGFNVAAASTCLPHRLQQAMGAVPSVAVSHGRGLAALYPAWLERAYPHAPERFDRAARLLGEDDVRAVVGGLLDSLEVSRSLRGWGFAGEDIETLVGAVQGNVDNDPIDGADRELIGEIYAAAL